MNKLCAIAFSLLPFLPLAACSTAANSSSALHAGRASDLSKPRPMPKLTKFFAANCAMCHGANGDEGFAPPLAGIAYPDYLHAIRTGHPDKGVPAFSREEYPDSSLRADYQEINAAIP